MPVCGNYLFFELPKKIVLNPKDGQSSAALPCLTRALQEFDCNLTIRHV